VITVAHYVTLSAILFTVGVTGMVTRRNALVLLMSVELMLNAANLSFVAFARHHGGMEGQVLAFFVIALAAAEVTVGLAILIAIFQRTGSVDAGSMNLMKG